MEAGKLNKDGLSRLLEVMSTKAREINPAKLGILDPDHIAQLWGGTVEHRLAKGFAWGLPFTVSVFSRKMSIGILTGWMSA